MRTITEDQIIHFISTACKVPSSRIHPHTSLRDDLLLDSIDVLLLIAALENNFKVYLTTEEAEAIDTAYEANYYVQKHAA